jgi:hypothetical protein
MTGKGREEVAVPKYLTIHNETQLDRVLLESRWTEISKDPRANWQMTLFNLELGVRYCEWDAPHPQVLKTIFGELGIKWSEILEIEVTSPLEWRIWELKSGQRILNCWEVMNCGLEPGGLTTGEKGVCPVAVEKSQWGKNRGLHAGRYCWKVIGTLCEDKPQGSVAEKMRSCERCEFFKRVKAEEGDRFEP